MFDIGWPELMVVAIVLIIVVGPKDLPGMLRSFGRTTKKLRAMAGDFRGQLDEALRDAELDDVRKTISDARSLNPMNQIRDAVNPLKQAGRDIRADLEKSVKSDTPVAVPDPGIALADGPPEFPAPSDKEKASPAGSDAAGGATSTAKAKAKPGAKAGATASSPAKKPAAKTSAAKTSAAKRGGGRAGQGTSAASKSSAAKSTTSRPSAPAASAKPSGSKPSGTKATGKSAPKASTSKPAARSAGAAGAKKSAASARKPAAARAAKDKT
ncbi:Sec-independent protein translocase protein TatB [Pseudohoeflea coraliihabitans]|uniref:Sec-independent protein translocase protein TatB n=1 Tax=Pseudohoeflea coraliihabitans TaxID=2860393 RepID=A0ABS6WQ90_9HYPH|nr:Sec-independent protein translocase protein TatB [Pseudohoeflea sp. DP4N28-3]MBW3098123.1 Sec-independent protein translocase protein TatB [Pseudohoeflea sp. DP4N28-3]